MGTQSWEAQHVAAPTLQGLPVPPNLPSPHLHQQESPWGPQSRWAGHRDPHPPPEHPPGTSDCSLQCILSEDALSSQNPCIPQRASSPSAGTSWIWYSEVWSIWMQTWCDLQGGKGDITSKTEQVLSVSLPLPLLQPQPTLWVNAKRGYTLTWHYSCAHLRILHQNRLTSLFCCYR